MTEEERLQYAYPDLVSVEDWLAAKGYTGEAGACHQAMSLIRSQEKRIAELKAALKQLAKMDERLADGTFAFDKWNEEQVVFNIGKEKKITVADLRAARAALGEKE